MHLLHFLWHKSQCDILILYYYHWFTNTSMIITLVIKYYKKSSILDGFNTMFRSDPNPTKFWNPDPDVTLVLKPDPGLNSFQNWIRIWNHADITQCKTQVDKMILCGIIPQVPYQSCFNNDNSKPTEWTDLMNFSYDVESI